MTDGGIPGVRYYKFVRVYRFMKSEWALRSIREGRMRVSLLTDLNDPFECLPLIVSNSSLRQSLEQTKTGWAKLFGVVSFSRSWHSPVLWAHYAEAHKGICLGFDIPDYQLKDVRYVDTRMGLNDLLVNDPEVLWLTKYEHWRYEDEVRLLPPLGHPEPDGHYYIRIDAGMRLTEVILGCRCRTTIAEVGTALSDQRGAIRVLRCATSEDTFEMVEGEELGVLP